MFKNIQFLHPKTYVHISCVIGAKVGKHKNSEIKKKREQIKDFIIQIPGTRLKIESKTRRRRRLSTNIDK